MPKRIAFWLWSAGEKKKNVLFIKSCVFFTSLAANSDMWTAICANWRFSTVSICNESLKLTPFGGQKWLVFVFVCLFVFVFVFVVWSYSAVLLCAPFMTKWCSHSWYPFTQYVGFSCGAKKCVRVGEETTLRMAAVVSAVSRLADLKKNWWAQQTAWLCNVGKAHIAGLMTMREVHYEEMGAG